MQARAGRRGFSPKEGGIRMFFPCSIKGLSDQPQIGPIILIHAKLLTNRTIIMIRRARSRRTREFFEMLLPVAFHQNISEALILAMVSSYSTDGSLEERCSRCRLALRDRLRKASQFKPSVAMLVVSLRSVLPVLGKSS